MAKKIKEPVLEVTQTEDVLVVGDEFIKSELTKFNIADATIAEWKEQYGSLKISDPNNKEEYDTLNQGRTFIKKKRIDVEKVGKGLRSNAIKFQKAVLEEERRIIALIDPLETYLEGEKQRIDDIKVEEKRLRDEKETMVLQERAVKLIQMGMTFMGDSYQLDDIKISVLQLKTADDFTHNILIAGLEKRFKEREAIRLEEERIKEENVATAKRIAEENLQKQEELRKQQEEINAQKLAIEQEQQRQKKAAEQLIIDQQNAEIKAKEEKLKSRKSALFALGFAQQNQRLSFKDLFFLESEIGNCSEEDWLIKLDTTTKNVTYIKEKIEQDHKVEIERAKQEAIATEKKRAELEAADLAKRFKEAEELRLRQEEERKIEATRLEALKPDAEKVKQYFNTINQFPLPEVNSDAFKTYVIQLENSKKSWLINEFNKLPK